jgi:hypothetical protein
MPGSRADAILMEAVDLPVLTEASALAVISLFIDDGWMLSQHRVYGDEFKALVGRRETTSPQPFKLRPGDAERGRPQLIYLKRAASGAYPGRAPGARIVCSESGADTALVRHPDLTSAAGRFRQERDQPIRSRVRNQVADLANNRRPRQIIRTVRRIPQPLAPILSPYTLRGKALILFGALAT